jgi:hypothetical protein
VSGVNEAGGLGAVDLLGEGVVEEDVLDVELVDGLTLGYGQCKHSLDCGELDDGAEGLVVVHLGALGEHRRTQRALYWFKEPPAFNFA